MRNKLIKLFKLFLSFSDEGEDKMMIEYFMKHKIRFGTYLDIGAYHPVKVSNTFLLYLWGWKGTCIDVNNKWLFKLLRPRDKFIYGFVESDSFYYYPKQVYTSEASVAKRYKGKCIYKKVPKIRVEDLPYADFLDIDVDGLDATILERYLSIHRPRYILAEDRVQEEQLYIEDYLTSIGYTRIAGTNRNGFYVL